MVQATTELETECAPRSSEALGDLYGDAISPTATLSPRGDVRCESPADPFDDFEDDDFDDDFEEDWEDDLTEDEEFPDTFGGEEPDGVVEEDGEEESPFADDPDFDD